ncbi:NAD(P)/FAD-dependent oxidoreductase [Acinetobacter boissieri]|uniref:NADH dehydrogenase n=1 Tax=Acinetobacter boissieri TaxID=1219383 RepID=A0A1G6H5U8_9GAMM|nr:NAD(P)/FAD-dependent oxidoreductase [Acinetobacter boissieri]SDB89523.1 NADH dehydrogenase [Acinetobacter boissieri]
MNNELHRIVIVGGGAGGLELATQLGNTLGKHKKAQITLIDRSLSHIWKPLLHEIAAGTLNPHSEETNYFAHAKKHHYQFILGQFEGLDKSTKNIKISTPQLSEKYYHEGFTDIHYDTLVLAIGSRCNDFNTKGVRDNCYFLDNREQADVFQQDLFHLYLNAQNSPEKRMLNIAIIGAGATGVELSAELIDAKENFNQYGLDHIDPKSVKITLIEATNRILPVLSASISAQTQKTLEKMGIDVLTEHKVSEVTKDSIQFADGKTIPADMIVWAAGVKAPPVLELLEGFEKDRINRLKVYATLQTLSEPSIFALGDCAHCQPDAHEPPLAPRAQVASQQASFLAEAIPVYLRGGSMPMFSFTDKGSLVSLSRNKAIGEILGQVKVHGALARSMYASLYRIHQTHIHGYTQAGLMMTKDFVTRRVGPKIKLY